jgi:ferredoxin-NADP reductase/predicted pyridoxine 5'-phosphate oxidase superfamily flavin-nucleotide-binding protein
MAINSPYHEGELAIQQRVDETETARINAGAIDKTILAGALRFIEQQPMVVIGSMDPKGQVWVSTLFGNPGFIRAVDNKTLELDISQPRSAECDPLWNNLLENPDVGLLVIELGSRRRIRINGRARKVSAKRILIDVERAYPNCPKYIQRRDWKTLDTNEQHATTPGTFGEKLNESQKKLIQNADTLFVASAHPDHGVDASHRGGHPGFVHIFNNQQLRIPDFTGNSMFNTLGNFTSYPYAGIIFVDFGSDISGGRLLQLTGKAEILWDMDDSQQDDSLKETGGTRRYWQFDITRWQESVLPYRFSWELLDASPFIPELQRYSNFDETLSLQVEHIQQETDRVKSFRLRADDGKALPEVLAGAHLQVMVKLPDGSEAKRHYSLLNHPDDRSWYEIGVLKEPEGRGGSRYMHEHVSEGDTLEIQLPKNAFPMATHANHSILIAGGIGITPILSMMHILSSRNKSFEMHYSARTFAGLAFRDRIERVASDSANFYATKEPNGQRLDLKELLATPKPGVHVYICGPRGMISAVREVAEAKGWHLSQIHFESFGAQPLANDKAIRVHLVKSNQSITVPANRSILDTLLDADIDVPHDCKRGECTMCTTRVIEGDPDHRDLCLSAEEKASSMCVCVSRACGEELKLDL